MSSGKSMLDYYVKQVNFYLPLFYSAKKNNNELDMMHYSSIIKNYERKIRDIEENINVLKLLNSD